MVTIRLLLKLRSLKDTAYDVEYYHKLQGVIYNAIRSLYPQLHDLDGYRFFCFSNIFPLKVQNGSIPPIREGGKRYLMVSSPDRAFIKAFQDGLDEEIHIGDMSFQVEDVKPLNIKLDGDCTLVSATPIVVRIPEYNYDKYNIPEESRKNRYVYWRRNLPFNVFVRQMEENLYKKYNEYHNTQVEEEPLFQQFKLKKAPVITHTMIDGQKIQLVGSLWEFPIKKPTQKQKKILEFSLDCGFGERNPLGHGYTNKKQKNT